MEREPLELNGLEATPTIHTSGFWICKGTPDSSKGRWLGRKAALEADLSFGEMKRKVSLILGKPDPQHKLLKLLHKCDLTLCNCMDKENQKTL